ncbi:MAG: hypothetical protein ACEQSK_18640, partial [Sphingomonadaceae bacterium]
MKTLTSLADAFGVQVVALIDPGPDGDDLPLIIEGLSS